MKSRRGRPPSGSSRMCARSGCSTGPPRPWPRTSCRRWARAARCRSGPTPMRRPGVRGPGGSSAPSCAWPAAAGPTTRRPRPSADRPGPPAGPGRVGREGPGAAPDRRRADDPDPRPLYQRRMGLRAGPARRRVRRWPRRRRRRGRTGPARRRARTAAEATDIRRVRQAPHGVGRECGPTDIARAHALGGTSRITRAARSEAPRASFAPLSCRCHLPKNASPSPHAMANAPTRPGEENSNR